MHEPSSLSSRARAILRAGRAAHTPTAEEQARVRTSLEARLGAAALFSAPAHPPGAESGGGSLGSGAAVTASSISKLAVVAVLAAGSAAGVVALRRHVPPAPALIQAAPPAPLESPPPVLESESPLPTAPAPAPRRSPVASEGVAGEVRLLRAAQDALRAGQPAVALRLVDRHAARYPRGAALVEERSAARILALCGLGRQAEARHATERFMRQWPHSPLASRVQAECNTNGRSP